MEKNSTGEKICCPKFDPAPWDGKILEWQDKKFIRDSVTTLFYMPLNFGSVMRKVDKQVTNAGAAITDWLCLSDHTSKWNMDLYIATDKEIPGANNTTLTGSYASKVYEGPFSETAKWHQDFGKWCTSQQLKPDKYFMWYTTCPKCAKKYGKNYVVILARLNKN